MLPADDPVEQEPLIRRAASYSVFPLGVGGFTALTWGLIRLGLAPMVAFGVSTALAVFVVLGLERVLPFREAWNRADGQLANDVGHTAFGTLLGGQLGLAANDVLFGGLAVLWAARAGGSGWPTGWPFLLQLVAVAMIADLGRYVQHRLHHAVPLLWRFHALHHDVPRLGVIKTARSHLVERVLQMIFMFGPLVALGAPTEVVFWFMVANNFVGILDHSNVDARIGPFEWLVNGPASHRLHHALDPVAGNANFGSALVFWDMIFGTWLNPLARPDVGDVGVAVPGSPGFLRQCVDPFVPRAEA